MLVVNAEELRRVTKILSKSVDLNGLEELRNVLVIPKRDHAFIWGTDMITFAKVRVEATSNKSDRPLLLPFRELSQFASAWSGEVAFEDRSTLVRLVCDDDYVDLPKGDKPSEYIDRYEIDETPVGVCVMQDLGWSIRVAHPLVNKDHQSQALTGIHLGATKGKAVVESADGFRYVSIVSPAKTKGRVDVVLNYKAGGLLSLLEGKAIVTISHNHAHIKFDGGVYSVLLNSAQYPDLSKVKKSKVGAIAVGVRELRALISKAKFISEKMATFTIGSELTCTAEDMSKTKEFTGSIELGRKGKPTKTITLDMYHLDYILSILSVPACEFYLGASPGDPMWLSKDGLTYLLMPFFE